MSQRTSPCPNCGSDMSGRYCSSCGQAAIHGRLDAHAVLHDAWHAFTHADIGLVRLIRGLATRPAATYAAYFAGARKQFANPVFFLLLVEGLYVVLVTLVMQHQMEVLGRTPQLVAELVVRQADKLKYLFGIPVLSGAAWLLFRRAYTFAEIVVFWLFCLAFVTLVDMMSFPALYLLPANSEAIKLTFGWLAGLTMAWHIITVFGRPGVWRAVGAVGLTLFTQVALNYAFRIVYRLKGYDVDFGLVSTLRDSFGL